MKLVAKTDSVDLGTFSVPKGECSYRLFNHKVRFFFNGKSIVVKASDCTNNGTPFADEDALKTWLDANLFGTPAV